MKLYSYQEKVLQAIENDSSSSQLISMPTGTGKTITFLFQALKMKKPVLILVHREELLNQTLEKAILIGFKKDEIGIISSGNKDEIKPLTIAMVQTLNRNLEKYSCDSILSMIVDEAHHSLASSYMDIFKHFKIHEENKLLLGFTATPLRGDRKMLETIYKSHSFKMTLSEATQLGFICPVYGIKIQIEKSLSQIDTVNGDYDIVQLDKVMNCDEINHLIVDKLTKLDKFPGIIFCTSIDHTHKLAKLLREKGLRAIGISYKTPKKTLEKIFRFLKEGRLHFIVNAVKLTEGFDYPPIQSIIIARPTRSPVLYKQMIGRGLRKSEGKYDCIVMEFAANDQSMINWEDIDENCSFQSYNDNDVKSREEALNIYKQRFNSDNIVIKDVRISPFNFYECKISRLIHYRKFWYLTFTDNGFTVFNLLPDPLNGKCDKDLYNSYSWLCFWKNKYKEFYVWSHGNGWGEVSLDGLFNYTKIGKNCVYSTGATLKEAINWFKHYMNFNHHSRWYPSEYDPITSFQKQFLRHPYPKTNARKCEMDIEEMAVKKAINKYFIPKKAEKLMIIDWP